MLCFAYYSFLVFVLVCFLSSHDIVRLFCTFKLKCSFRYLLSFPKKRLQIFLVVLSFCRSCFSFTQVYLKLAQRKRSLENDNRHKVMGTAHMGQERSGNNTTQSGKICNQQLQLPITIILLLYYQC